MNLYEKKYDIKTQLFPEYPKCLNFHETNLKGTVMQIEKALKNNRLRVSKVS